MYNEEVDRGLRTVGFYGATSGSGRNSYKVPIVVRFHVALLMLKILGLYYLFLWIVFAIGLAAFIVAIYFSSPKD